MSSIVSPVKAISSLCIHPLKSKYLIRNATVYRVADVTLVIDREGQLYCNRFDKARYYTRGIWPWTEKLMTCLVAARVITRKQLKQHIADAKAHDEKRDRRFSAGEFDRAAKKFGIKLTKAQRAAIERAQQP